MNAETAISSRVAGRTRKDLPEGHKSGTVKDTFGNGLLAKCLRSKANQSV